MQGKIMYLFSVTFLSHFAKLRKETFSVLMYANPSVRMEQLGCYCKTVFIFCVLGCVEKSVQNITSNLHEGLRIYTLISRTFLLRMRNVSDKSCKENQKTHFMFSDFSRKAGGS